MKFSFIDSKGNLFKFEFVIPRILELEMPNNPGTISDCVLIRSVVNNSVEWTSFDTDIPDDVKIYIDKFIKLQAFS